MIIELVVIKACCNRLRELKKENYTAEGKYKEDDDMPIGVLIAVLFIAVLSLIGAIWGIVDAVRRCKGEDRVIGILLAIFIWPLYWILRWSGAVCKKQN